MRCYTGKVKTSVSIKGIVYAKSLQASWLWYIFVGCGLSRIFIYLFYNNFVRSARIDE